MQTAVQEIVKPKVSLRGTKHRPGLGVNFIPGREVVNQIIRYSNTPRQKAEE